MSNLELGVYQGPNLSQQLGLAPQLLQWLRLLQAPTAELSQLVRHELETNPALEADELAAGGMEAGDGDDEGLPEMGDRDGEPLSEIEAKFELFRELDAEWREDHGQNKGLNRGSRADEEERHQFILDSLVADTTLAEHLLRQLGATGLTGAELALAELIVGSLDERGYLCVALDELAAAAGVPTDRAGEVLRRVQALEPAGIAARDLRECLLLQARAAWGATATAARLLQECPDLLAERREADMARHLGVAESEVRAARAALAGLNPEPGRAFTAPPVQYVEPDVCVRRRGDDYEIELNDDFIPHLRLSGSVRRLLEERNLSAADQAWIRRKIRNAAFLIQGIGQRQETLRKVVQEIVRVQREYFDQPDGELRPLTMVKVASVLGVHETTVSRAIANKYIQTPRGLHEMKFFFRIGYQCSDGSTLTPESVKELIAGLVAGEDPARPLTDLEIGRALQQKGLRLARRTVAKYRDELGIDSSKERARYRAPRGKIRLLPATPPAPAVETPCLAALG